MRPEDVSVVWVSEGLSSHGGSEYCTLSFCKLLISAGSCVSIVTPPGILPAWLRLANESGISIYEAKSSRESDILEMVIRQCVRQKANVVNFIPWSAILSRWSDICPSDVATIVIEPTSADNTCYWLPENNKYAPADAIAVLNPAAQIALKSRMIDDTPISFIPNVLLPVYPLSRPKKSRKIAVVARLSLEKGHSFLIAALSLMPPEYNDVTLHIYGEGTERNNLETLVVMLGLTDRVIFEGAFEPFYGLRDAMKDICIAVLPSLFEGMPIALMEYMSLGIPIVSTNSSGGRKAMGDYKYLVDIGDTGNLANAICKLLDSELEQNKSIEWGRLRLNALLNKEVSLESLLKLYSVSKQGMQSD